MDFDGAHPLEFDGYTVIQSETEVTEEIAQAVIPVHGSIYVGKITEIKEKDMRFITPKRVIYLDKQWLSTHKLHKIYTFNT